MTMSQEERRSLDDQLERLATTLSTLSATDWSQVWASDRTRQLFEQIVDVLGIDAEILQQFGLFTIEQAYTKICDLLQENKIPRLKTFNHCGHDHEYHALQCNIRCPICKTYHAKTRGFLADDEIEDVACLVLRWLKIDPKTIPDWNAACDRF